MRKIRKAMASQIPRKEITVRKMASCTPQLMLKRKIVVNVILAEMDIITIIKINVGKW